MDMPVSSSITEQRALVLLGQNIPQEIVAASLGVTPGRISQLMGDQEFRTKVEEARFKNLSKHAERDDRYYKLEDDLLERMESMIPLMYKPREVLHALQVINVAKKSGIAPPIETTAQKDVVTLSLPSVIINQFNAPIQVNVNNQVIKAGNQELVTVQSAQMSKLLERSRTQRIENQQENSNEQEPSPENRTDPSRVPETNTIENCAN